MKRLLCFLLAISMAATLLILPGNAASYTDDLAATANACVGKTYRDLGLPASNWCCYFIRYCANHSAVKSLANSEMPLADGVNPMTLINWACAKKKIGTYYSFSSTHYTRLSTAYQNLSITSTSVNGFTPMRGDIVIFDWSGRENPSHVFSHAGIVTDYNASSSKVTYVDGNSGTGSYTYVVKKTTGKSSNSIIGYIRFGDRVAPAPESGTSPVSPSPDSTESTETGKWTVTIPANYKLICYDSATATQQSAYWMSAKPAAYTLTCTKKATLSNGTTRYFFVSGDNKNLWFNYNSQMSVVDKAVKTYTITFDANGGRVSPSTIALTAGQSYRNLPTPAYAGYQFIGWSLDKIDPNTTETLATSIVRDPAAFGFTDDITLYAIWEKQTPVVQPSPQPEPEPVPEPEPEPETIWTPWSDWSTTKVTPSSTRQVETREVKVSDAYTQYRYGRFVADGHDCWCRTYLQNLSYVSGTASLDYTSWSTTRFGTSGRNWTCGYCNGIHTGVHHTDSNGRPVWVEYKSPSGASYYWEETRTVPAVYETQYRYRDLIQ